MKSKLVAGFCAGVMALGVTPTAFADVHTDDMADKIKQLEAQLQTLKTMMEKEKKMRDEQAAAMSAEVAKAKETTAGPLKLGSNTTLSYGGFIKYNAMYDDYQDGAVPAASIASRILVPSLIPVGNSAASESPKFNSDIATSRFYFKTVTDTDAGQLMSYVELDFLSGGGDERVSNSNNPRVRHAFLDWKYSDDMSLRIGQNWSTFFNVGSLAESVEFVGSTAGTLLNRQQMIRWTKKTDGGSIQLALENPSTSLTEAGFGVAGSNFDDNSIPDIIARYNGKSGNHTYALSAMGREIAYDDGTFSESKFGFAANFGGKVVLANGNDIRYNIAHGNLGRYMALNAFRDGGIDAAGNLDLTSITGGHIAYRHKWSEKLRSTIQYAYSKADLANGISSANTESVSNLNLNLIYSPTPKLTFGGAIVKADRELENGDDGSLTRLQFTAKYGF